jgi:hypothetical protein
VRAGDGTEIARFSEREQDGRRFADFLVIADGVPEDRAVEALLAELAGWRVAAPVPLGRRLVEAGARATRHSHLMTRDLVRDPPPTAWLEASAPAGARLTAVDRPAIELAHACRAAYPPDHPDFAGVPAPPEPEVELEEIVSGRLMGPLLRCSGLAVDADGAVIGAILVTGMSGEPPEGGPWIGQIFRHPDAPRGTGAALLRRALAIAARDGLPAVGLAVTEGNAARELYRAHGFADAWESLSVDIP